METTITNDPDVDGEGPHAPRSVSALVVAWCAAVYFLGAKITERTTGPGWLSGVTGQATSWARKLMKKA